jgi:hypothetical protein
VLPLDMVDKSISPLQTYFGPVFGNEAVQPGCFFQSEAPGEFCCEYLHLSPGDLILHPPLASASQTESGDKGQVSTSRAVHRRVVLPAAMAGVRCR